MTSTTEGQNLAVQLVLRLPPHARVLLVGASDTGKTTLAVTLVRELARAGRLPVAVVDGDIGQSEIGAPGTVGLGVLSVRTPGIADGADLRSLSRIPAVAAAFVGALTPEGHSLDTASAIIQMTQSAMLLKPRPHCTIIDTPGYVSGAGASLLRALVEIIRPHLVVALARDAELDPILRPLEMAASSHSVGAGNVRVHREPIAPDIGRKSSSVRATRRAAKFAQHLNNARELSLDWTGSDSNNDGQSVVLQKTWLSYGQSLPPHELQFIGRTLGSPCLHAERLHGGDLMVITGSKVSMPQARLAGAGAGQIGILEQSLGVKRVLLEPASEYDQLLCGLLNAPGDLLGIGLITGIDFLRRSLTVLTPVRTASVINRLVFGAIRLRPDGREIAQPTGRARR